MGGVRGLSSSSYFKKEPNKQKKRHQENWRTPIVMQLAVSDACYCQSFSHQQRHLAHLGLTTQKKCFAGTGTQTACQPCPTCASSL